MSRNIIYKITNVLDNKTYIGSSVKGLSSRKNRHLWELKKNIHHNYHLQREYNKHGENILKFEEIDRVMDVSQLTNRENYWIQTVNPDYNVMRDVKSHIGVKRTEETCKKISEGVRNHLNNLNKSRIGKKYTDEHRRNISESLSGRKLSKEHIQKMSNSLKGIKPSKELAIKRTEHQHKSIIQIDKFGNIVKEWKSATIVEIESIGKFKRKMIYRCLSGERKFYKNHSWKHKS